MAVAKSANENAFASALVGRAGFSAVWIVDRSGGCTAGRLESGGDRVLRIRGVDNALREIPVSSVARAGFRRNNKAAGIAFGVLFGVASLPLAGAAAVGTDRDEMLLVVAGGSATAGFLLGRKVNARKEVWEVERRSGADSR